MNRRVALRAVGLGLFAAAAGCSDAHAKTAPVRGKIIYKGEPVPNGTVNFIPEAGGPSATGEIQKDGTFTLTTYSRGDGAVLGKHKVVIVAMQDGADILPEARTPTPPPIVPVKYTSPATSTLSATVEDKDNQVEFDLGK